MPEETQHSEISGSSWVNLQRKLVVIYSVIGIILGYVSYLINSPPSAFGIMVVVLIILFFITKKVIKYTGKKRWWGNPVFAYIFFWLVSWTIFYNVYVV